MKKLYRTIKYWILWRFTGSEAYELEHLHYWHMKKFAPYRFTCWTTHHERFKWIWRFGLSKGETAQAIHFPRQGGKWWRVVWKLYFQTTKKGYNYGSK